MTRPFLYSTNPFIKLIINERFRKDLHYVWCGEHFDSKKHGSYSSVALTAPSSDPCVIYKQLADDVSRGDQHSAKIVQMRASLENLAVTWRNNGEITPEEAEEIVYMVKQAPFANWRPLVYVIPYSVVASRLKLVPIGQRASMGIEYILPDLARQEFDIIEL